MTIRRFIEITAKSAEEARQIAERELKEGEIIVGSEVLKAPARGIFGIVGSPETRIRFICETREKASHESEHSLQNTSPSENSFNRTEETHKLSDTTSDRPSEDSARVSDWADTADGTELEDDIYETDDNEDLDDYDGQTTSDEESDDEKTTANEQKGNESSVTAVVDDGFDVTKDPMWGQIKALLEEVATTLGVQNVNFRSYRKDGHSIVEAMGSNLSQLIGKHGRTLDSLQYLVNIILNRGREDRTKILLDVQGYREKRHKNLIMLANRMYRKVIDTGRQVELEPMSTLDRRTIHLALKDREGVETFSRGVEPMRRVIIAPKRSSGLARKEGRRHGNRNSSRFRTRAQQQESSQVGTSQSTVSSGNSTSVPMFFEEDGSDEG